MTLDRIVIGVDFSAASTSAVRWVARHFAPAAELALVHSPEVDRPPGFLEGVAPPPDELERAARRGAEDRFRDLAESLPAVRLRTEVRDGAPAEVVAAAAAEAGADLIVVGAHGRRSGVWDVLGSTAERLLHATPVPVLLAQRLPPAAPRRILAPVDASPVSRRVLRWARFLQDRFDAEIAAMHVLEMTYTGVSRLVSSVRGAERTEARLEEQTSDWLRDRVREAGLEPERSGRIVTRGEADHEIIAAARRFGVELVVMGSHGEGLLEQALLGSTARSVFRGAPCPVLVVARGRAAPSRSAPV